MQCSGQEKRMSFPFLMCMRTPPHGEGRLVDLLRHQVLLLAMKHGRAPLPVSPGVLKSLLRRGILNDLHDLGSVARRLSFLEDERILLAELNVRAEAAGIQQDSRNGAPHST
jgi:hypothetical protein